MNQELKAKWIEALRSGKYKQGKKYLRHGDCFCCLGVLCDIVSPDKWGPTGNGSVDIIVPNNGAQGYLPPSVQIEVGISTEIMRQLARLNDHGYSFNEISNMIEKAELEQFQ